MASNEGSPATEAPTAEAPERVDLPGVIGTELSFFEAVEAELVETPRLTSYKEWLAWRRGAGMRPPGGGRNWSLGDSALWRLAMERYHGPDWRSTLEEAEAAAADEEEEAEASREETTRVEGPPGLGSASSGLASSAGTEELRYSIFESRNAGEGVEALATG